LLSIVSNFNPEPTKDPNHDLLRVADNLKRERINQQSNILPISNREKKQEYLVYHVLDILNYLLQSRGLTSLAIQYIFRFQRTSTVVNMTDSKSNVNHDESSHRDDNSMQMSVPSRNITVYVSGSRFCIVPSLFKQIENLQWKKHKSHSRNNKTLKLNANPDVFESVLQFFLSSKLPDSKSLSARRAKTLIDFVSPLDPVAVKPLIDYLQPFVVEKPSSAKASFMRRGFAPFSSRDSRSKRKESNQASSDRVADKSSSHTSSNNHKPKNSDDHLSNRTGSCTNAPPAVVSSIPTHIEHPVTTSTTIAEISVCSLDESLSVSKLSIQSSSVSLGMTIPLGPQNENSMPASSSTSTHHQLDHLQKQKQQYEYQYQNHHQQGSSTAMNRPLCTQDAGFSVDNHARAEPHSATSIGHERSNVPTKSDSWERICNEHYRQYHPQSVVTEPHSATSIGHENYDTRKSDSWERICNEHYRQYHSQPAVKANDFDLSTQTPSPAMTDVKCDNSKKKRHGVQNNYFNSHRLRATSTKIIRTVLGQEQKTHADWCASECVV
jgi:hypothetical protein